MFISLHFTPILVLALSCLASAFSTLFVTEGPEEVKKMEVVETKTPKMEENNAGGENQMIIKTIPFFTNIISKVEDAMNLTPLKVATIISAQHLIDSVTDIGVPGNLPQDTLKMLNSIVEDFNKTTQIIKLTAEYVNISSHYILNSLQQVAKENCDEDYIKSMMETINSNFLKVISNEVKATLNEIMKKTAHREMTGTDVLVSSSYHIVTAFQEMTSQVMSLRTDNVKCHAKTIQSHGESNLMDLDKTAGVSKFGVTQKSIKKDKVLQDTNPILRFSNQGNLDDSITNIDKNPDLTLEIYPSESIFLGNKDTETHKVKIPESLKVAFLPEIKPKTIFSPSTGLEQETNKIEEKNFPNFRNIFTVDTMIPQENIALETLSSKNTGNKKESELNDNNQKNLESLSVYYYPLKSFTSNNKVLPYSNLQNYLKTTVLSNQYNPKNVKATTNTGMHEENIKPDFKTFSLFGISDLGNFKNPKPHQKQDYDIKKTDGLHKSLTEFDDTIGALNRQDLTMEVFSPEAFIHNVDVSSEERTNYHSNLEKNNPPINKKWVHGNIRDENLQHMQNHKWSNYKDKKYYSDREQTDSLSNVQSSMSLESKRKNVQRKKIKSITKQDGLSTILMPWEKRFPQNPKSIYNHQRHNSCNGMIEPICGVDKNQNNFIIFLNDCERKHHNSLHNTNYQTKTMNTCVGFLLKNSSGLPNKFVNMIPK